MAIFHGTAIPSSGDFYEHPIEQSLRFNDDDTAYLSWTPSVDRSANVWTVSFWFKRGNLGSSSWFPIWEADNGTNSDSIGIYQDKLSFSLASATRTVTIPDYFRDPSAWYHLVISWDTNETGLTDTLKIWLNGVRKTSYSAYINSLILDSDTLNFGRNVENRIGARSSGTAQYFDGYLAEFNFIDGTALDASSFGESKSGTWIPKAYTGSYGTNGFYLDGQISENHEFDQGRAYSDAMNTWRCSGNVVDYYHSFSTSASGSFKLKVYVDDNDGGYHKLQYQVNGGAWTDLYSSTSAGNYSYTSGAISGTGTVNVRMCVYRYNGNADANIHTIKVWYFPDSSDTDLYAFDQSGNGNNFDLNNIVPTDVVLDSPTNNFATFSPLLNRPTFTDLAYYEGNLKVYSSGRSDVAFTGFAPTSGKWYVEALKVDGTRTIHWGLVNINNVTGNSADRWLGTGNTAYDQNIIYVGTGSVNVNNSTVATGKASISAGDILGVAFDCDAGSVSFYVNGTLQYTHSSNLSWLAEGACFYVQPDDDYAMANFGQDSSFAGNKTAQGNTDDNGYGDFYYAPPTGYLALCTANLEVPEAMDPALDASPQDYFNTVLYTGSNTNNVQSNISVGFQPDLLWIKNRDNVEQHHLMDSVRGENKFLFSSRTDAESSTAYADSSGTVSVGFNADGFDIIDSNVAVGELFFGTRTYAAWNWKAGTSYTPTVTGGFSSPSASINTDAGFGIYKVTGSNSTSSFTHGLGTTPDLFIAKNIDNTYDWAVWSRAENSYNDILKLNTTDAKVTKTGIIQTLDDTEIEVNSYAETASNGDYIYYVFSNREGFSKFGSYTGNGSGDGTFCYTGFKPAFVMIKRTDSSGWWHIWDIERDTYNHSNHVLFPNETSVERTYTPPDDPVIDILSNGFKQRGYYPHVNASGGTYIYMAFAENPFKYANAR